MSSTDTNLYNSNLENEFIAIVDNDAWMIEVLRVVKSLNLNDWWIGAGFVRNKIWDVNHGNKRTELNDIDVIHFDPSNSTEAYDLELENKLKKLHPNLKWSIKNQSRMHLRNEHLPYINCHHAISFWPETATAVAVKLNSNDQIEYIAPYGLHDLFNLIVKPTPNFDLEVYNARIEKKQWKKTWGKLDIRTDWSEL
ncbi:nucleotidyltransferase family protein [Zhouia amylolytica]|uniref:Nucleotidyltransferase family protein n=1 Tax=Zhouia amylolytica AD3 TaxID=1286632 RepID=W2UIV9_9FLAO|nr:nucleotidyltransferase family protein [Zhouia amylolytica]ETN93953.1 hypothetical protein P278_31340 [Zhouia amylolytica AD3]